MEHPLGSEYQVDDVLALYGVKEVVGVLGAGLGLVEEAVAFADVDQFLLQFPERLGETSFYLRSLGRREGVLPRDREELLPVLFDEFLSDPLYRGEFGRNALRHLPQRFVGTDRRHAAVGIHTLVPQSVPEIV